MTAALILNQAQAEAVYSAICALNNVHLRGCDLRFGNAIVQLDFNGTVRVIGTAVVDDERYADDAAFATAYGLNIDEQESAPSSYACTFGQRNYGAFDGDPQSDVAAAAPAEPAAKSKCPGGAACGWGDESKMGDSCRVCGEQIPF